MAVASLGIVNPPKGGIDLTAKGATFTLSGVDTSNLARVLRDSYQGRENSFWLGFLVDGLIWILLLDGEEEWTQSLFWKILESEVLQ